MTFHRAVAQHLSVRDGAVAEALCEQSSQALLTGGEVVERSQVREDSGEKCSPRLSLQGPSDRQIGHQRRDAILGLQTHCLLYTSDAADE